MKRYELIQQHREILRKLYRAGITPRDLYKLDIYLDLKNRKEASKMDRQSAVAEDHKTTERQIRRIKRHMEEEVL